MKYVLLLGFCSLLSPHAFADDGNHRPTCLTGSVVCPDTQAPQSLDPYAWPAPPGADARCVVTPEIIAIRRTNNPAQIQAYDSYLTTAGCPGMFKPPLAPNAADRFASIPEPKAVGITSLGGDRSPASNPPSGERVVIEHPDPKTPDPR